MKRILLTVLALALVVPAAHAVDWTPIPSGTTGTIRAIHNHNQELLFAGDGGYFARAQDGYTGVTVQSTGTTANLISTIRVGADFVSGANGVFRMTFDGINWVPRNIPNAAQSFVVFSHGNGSAYAIGTGGSIYHTDNYGFLWTSQGQPTPYALHAGTDGATVVGDHGTILRTSDIGATWATLTSGTTADLFGILDNNGPVLIAVGANGRILRSINSGSTWTTIASGTTATLRAIDYLGGPNTSSWATGARCCAPTTMAQPGAG